MNEHERPTDRAKREAAIQFAAKARRETRTELENARHRLASRYGSDQEKHWVADPNGPLVDPVSLLGAFLHKAARPAPFRSAEMDQAPTLEREDALAAAWMIHAARADARRREITAMRHILALVTWDELAQVLETTPEELRAELRRQGEHPETWTSGER